MKKFSTLFAVLLTLMMGACQNSNSTAATATGDAASTNPEAKKTTLVAYFSASEAHVTAQVAKTLA